MSGTNDSGGTNDGSDEDTLLPTCLPSGVHDVPATSYSSSDDDDYFYDANDETPTVLSAISAVRSSSGSLGVSSGGLGLSSGGIGVSAKASNMTLNSDIAEMSPSDIQDYDALYEDDEEELGSLEGHGSVIAHLISQVKIGMDLTKVVLPTFILERRSLLEMYADFFAHPDLFIS